MAKLIQVVHSSTGEHTNYTSYYVNVEMVRSVAQTLTPNRCMIWLVGSAIPMPIEESAASFISRAGAG